MPGETDLKKLCEGVDPVLRPGTFVFCTLADRVMPAGLQPIGTFDEAEGLTLIVPKGDALRFGLPYQFESALVTLNIHSSLEAVGFMAVISTELARHGIACNVVSAWFHDHLFVPVDEARRVIELVKSLSSVPPEGA